MIFSSMKGRLRACFVPLVIALILFGAAWNQYEKIFAQTPKENAADITFEVQQGESFSSVAERLEQGGLIASAFWFRVAAELSGKTVSLLAGQHILEERMNYLSILAALARSADQEVQVTIPEGYTLAQMGELFVDKLGFSTAEWNGEVGVHASLENHEFVASAEKPDTVDLEGYLFPDTYRFFVGENAEGVASKMLDTMEMKFDSLGTPTGDASQMTTHQILTLASIVEREVRDPDEMAQVADIFLKRLEIGMPLQADSTVNYVTGGKYASISLTDTELDSPYNTYKNPGLPPGPISNPGLNALKAVLHPAENDYFYFLTDAEGNVHYAKTFEEHLANKQRYLK